MKFQYPAIASSLCALLCACGGGGEQSIGSTPPPPASSSNASLVDLRFSQEFAGHIATVAYRLSRITGGILDESGTSPPVGAFLSRAQVRYDVRTQSYELAGSFVPAVNVGPAEQIASSSATTGYRRVVGNQQDDVVLFKPGAGNPELALTYASYGAWQRIADNGTELKIDTSFFTYGIETTPSEMPKTGSATYQTKIDGQFADTRGVFALAGDSHFDANFASGAVNFTMNPVGRNVVDESYANFGQLVLTGSIKTPGQAYKGNEFSAETGSAGAYAAQMQGAFYGPGAAELGGTFLMNERGGGQGRGSGAVVGKKN